MAFKATMFGRNTGMQNYRYGKPICINSLNFSQNDAIICSSHYSEFKEGNNKSVTQ